MHAWFGPQHSASKEKLLPVQPVLDPDLDLDLECGDEPPKNRAGETMRRSLIDPRKYYCGCEVEQDDDGKAILCDPIKGQQCKDCKKAQRFIEKTDTSRPVNAKGRVMKRGTKRRDLFYCGIKGCGPHKGMQCQSCEEAQDEICRLVAEEQNADLPMPEQLQQLVVTNGVPAKDSTCCACVKWSKCCLDLECGLCKCFCECCTRAQAFCCKWFCKCCAWFDLEMCKCCAWFDWEMCKCCVWMDWELCKCCVHFQELLCKCCCRAEIGFSECYFQIMRASAKVCWKSPCLACLLFLILEFVFVGATFRLPTVMKHIIGDEGYVWGFILVIFIICCLFPCCVLCAPCAVVVHEARAAQKQLLSLESRIESLADSGAGLADRIGQLEEMFERGFGRVGQVADSLTHPSCLGRK